MAEPDEIPPEASATIHQYRRFERRLRLGIGVVVMAAVVVTAVTLPWLWLVTVSALAILALRVPIFALSGSVTLVTDEAPERVRADFTGPRSPVLAFQWGLADEVRSTASGWTYDLSYWFDRRSVSMQVDVAECPDGLTLSARENGRPWGTYEVTVGGDGQDTAVEIKTRADRRFPLPRLAQLVAAMRFQRDVLEAQGYAVRDLDRSVRVLP